VQVGTISLVQDFVYSVVPSWCLPNPTILQRDQQRGKEKQRDQQTKLGWQRNDTDHGPAQLAEQPLAMPSDREGVNRYAMIERQW
jgi:hypothetical protein